MKKIFFLLALLPVIVSAQYAPNNNSVETSRIAVNNTLSLPSGCGVPSGAATLRGGYTNRPAAYFDTCGHKLYIWDNSIASWKSLSFSDSTIWATVTKVKNDSTLLRGFINALISDSAYQASQIALRVKYSDTAAMLNPGYPRTNRFLDSIYSIRDLANTRITKSDADTYYPSINRTLDSLAALRSANAAKLNITDAASTYPTITRFNDTATSIQSRIQTKEPLIAAGTTGQYWRGDKTWQTLDKTAVGLGNVDNTSDANKPISTATQTALNGKQATLVSGTNLKTVNSNSLLGSGNIAVEPTITAGTTSDYWRGDKSWQALTKSVVGLANVDNTSDLNKPISTATQTALDTKVSKAGDVMTGFLTLNADPTNSLHAVTKNYVDNAITGITWKNAAIVATTANITLSGTQTIDGISVVAGDRVLVKNQSTASQNGIYIVASGSWTRATDADSPSELTQATVFTERGTIGANTQWTQTGIINTVGADAVAFTQISGAGTYTNGTYISLTGNVFDVNSTFASQWNSAYTNRITSLTTTGSSGAATLSANVLNIPNYTIAGLGGVAANGAITGATKTKITYDSKGLVTAGADATTSDIAEGTNLYYTEARVNANTNVAANTAARHDAMTIGTANGLSRSGQLISLALASTSTTGALSSTDWNTFNAKENALTFGTGLNRTGNTITSTITQYTDALARASLSFAAGSGAYNNSTGVITIPTNTNHLTNGAGFLTNTTGDARYLQLTGGTLSGNLRLNVASPRLELYNPTTANGAYAIAVNASGVLSIVNDYGGVTPFSIAANSAITLINSLNLTSGNVNINSGGLNQGNGTLNWNANFYTGGATASYVQVTNGSTGSGSANGLLVGLDGTGNAYLNQQSNFAVYIKTNNITRLTISNSGVATFSNNVETGGNFIANSSNGLSVGGFLFGATTNNKAYIYNPNYGTNTVEVDYNSNNTNIAATLTVVGATTFTTTIKATGFLHGYRSVSSSTTLTADDYYIKVTATATITLPTAVGRSGQRYFIKATSGTTSLATTSSQTIDGSSAGSFTLIGANGAYITLVSDGANWFTESYNCGC